MSNSIELGKTKTLFPHDEWFQNVGQYYMLDSPELLRSHVHPHRKTRGYRLMPLHNFVVSRRFHTVH
jgi:hypothetical protein